VTADVLVVGASGYFGRLLVEELLRKGHSVAAAGRSAARLKAALRTLPRQRLSFLELDLGSAGSVEQALGAARVVVCAAGPYQTLPSTLAAACLEGGRPYADLADDRGFVRRARELAASGARAPFAPGWSSVPALSALLARLACGGLSGPLSVFVHLAPGNRSERGAATIGSLLASLGRRFTVWRGGRWVEVVGGGEPRAFAFPAPIGEREGFLLDVPDLELLPPLLGARTVEFRAGAELRALQAAARALAALRLPLARHAAAVARPLGWLSGLGTEAGALGVEVVGAEGSRRACVWAERASPRIALLPALVFVEQALGGALPPGLPPLDAWLDRRGLERRCAELDLRLSFGHG
jgi:saccharopine dehydrogenase-like NADP-dependent oxidoreductase